jgi:predicted nucleic acid-binding protein
MIEKASGTKAYLDANIFILAFESETDSFAHLRKFFEFMEEIGARAVTSELTIAEVLAPSTKPRPNRSAFYQNLLIWADLIELSPVTRSVLIETADLRRQLPLKLADAIHVVTAQKAGCQYFLSADKDVRRMPAGLAHIEPSEKNIIELDALRV